MASARIGRLAVILSGAVFLSACEEGQDLNLFGSDRAAGGETTAQSTAMGTVGEDVESPETFQQDDTGLWDGRPSLGGVWIAHPNVTDPERVMIRNEDNGKSIIGALFRRERENPGPRFQVSSDAAVELGMLAGAPSNLSVVALQRVEAPVAIPAPEQVEIAALDTTAIAETEIVPESAETAAPDSVATIAASAIEAAMSNAPSASLPAPATAAEAALTATAPVAIAPVTAEPLTAAIAPATTAAPLSALEKPFVQIGIFSVESNAEDTSDLLRSSGVIPTIKVSNSSGKTYWRVVVGPLGSTSDRSAIIDKVRSLGFQDAYAVTN